MPDKVRELVNVWFAEAGRNGAFPLEDRVMLDLVLLPRPQLSAPREKYIYFPDGAEAPVKRSVNVRNRSYSLRALVDIPAPGAEGVLFACELGSLDAGRPVAADALTCGSTRTSCAR